MAWFILLLAGLSEVLWATGLKYSEGFSKPVPSLLTILFLIVSFWLLGISLKTLPLSVAYGVWVGIGSIGTVIIGIVLLNEPINILKVSSVILIILGILGLKLAS